MELLNTFLICSAVTIVIVSLAVFVCVSAKLDEVRLSRLTCAGWLLLVATVTLTIVVSFALGRRFYDVLTYASGRAMWRVPLELGVCLLALLLFALGKAVLTRFGVRIVQNRGATDVSPKPKCVPTSYWTFWFVLSLLGAVAALVYAVVWWPEDWEIFLIISLWSAAWAVFYWLGVFLERRRMRREHERQSHGNREA